MGFDLFGIWDYMSCGERKKEGFAFFDPKNNPKIHAGMGIIQFMINITMAIIGALVCECKMLILNVFLIFLIP